MQLIVVDEGNNYLGIIHLHDLIREGIIWDQEKYLPRNGETKGLSDERLLVS
jgi:hypothetical protein